MTSRRLEIEHLHHEAGWSSPGFLDIGPDGLVAAVHDGRPSGWIADELVSGFALPGIPNLHSHAFHRGIVGRTDVREPGPGDDLWTWRRAMYQFAARLGPDDMRAIAAMVYLESLRGGFTQVGEFHYLHRDVAGRRFADPATMCWALAEAAAEVGIGLTLLPVLYRHGGIGLPLSPDQSRFESSVEDVVGIACAIQDRGDPLLTAGVAPHSLRATTLDEIRALATAWTSCGGGPIHIHVAERVEEVDACTAAYGAPPIRLMLDAVGLDASWCFVHATHADPQELADVAKTEATVALCPMTEASLADGLFRFEAFGGRWGIGTDGHHTTDAALELRCLELGQRLRQGRRNVFAAETGIHRHSGRALVDGALRGHQALGGSSGSIEAGARADLVVLDGTSSVLAGHGPATVLDAWIMSGGASPVRDVMVAGRWLVRSGHHLAENTISERYRATMRRLLAEG